MFPIKPQKEQMDWKTGAGLVLSFQTGAHGMQDASPFSAWHPKQPPAQMAMARNSIGARCSCLYLCHQWWDGASQLPGVLAQLAKGDTHTLVPRHRAQLPLEPVSQPCQ